MTEEKIKRINELYHKSKEEGLNPEEQEEQAALRREYIQSVKSNLSMALEQVRIQEKDGTIHKPTKKKHK